MKRIGKFTFKWPSMNAVILCGVAFSLLGLIFSLLCLAFRGMNFFIIAETVFSGIAFICLLILLKKH